MVVRAGGLGGWLFEHLSGPLLKAVQRPHCLDGWRFTSVSVEEDRLMVELARTE